MVLFYEKGETVMGPFLLFVGFGGMIACRYGHLNTRPAHSIR